MSPSWHGIDSQYSFRKFKVLIAKLRLPVEMRLCSSYLVWKGPRTWLEGGRGARHMHVNNQIPAVSPYVQPAALLVHQS